MRPVTDSHKVSRAKLAYIIDSTAAPICIIAPISSWAAAVNSYVPADAGISGFQLFLRTIPYNLYAILTIAMVFYICYTGFDFGQMKLHEDNAAKGDLFTTGGEEFEQVSEQEVNPNGKVIDLVLPVAVLIVSAIGAMVYTGFLGGADNVISAFAGCDAETSLIFASVVTILFMMALYLPRKVITFKSFMDSLSEGFKLMVPAVTILVFAWTLKGVGDAMGLAQFVGSVVGDHASASIFIPVVLFAVAVFLSFSTGTSWGTFAILVPIATGMFAAVTNLEMMIISVSAVLAGAVCGDHISADLGYDGYVKCGCAEQPSEPRIDADAVCGRYGVCLPGGISDCSRDQNVVDHTWRQPSSSFGCFNRNAQILRKKSGKRQKIKKKTEKRVKCLTGEKKNRILKNRTNIHRTTVSCKEEAERFWSRNVNWNRRNWIF